MPPRRTDLSSYLKHLRALPFVDAIEVDRAKPVSTGGDPQVRLLVRTPARSYRLNVVAASSLMGVATLERHVREIEHRAGAWILMLPSVSAPMARLLDEHDVSYVDLQGNCRLSFERRFVALIEGRRPPRIEARDKSVRFPGYQVTFTFLAQPTLINETLRTIATVAEVSRQAASDAIARLKSDGSILKTRQGWVWDKRGWDDAIDRWVVGYRDAVRPRLLVGRYSPTERDPTALERRLRPALDALGEWRWGGTAAGYRLTGHYRGAQTVVHLGRSTELPADLHQRLKAMPDRNGSLVLLRAPNARALEGHTTDTVHPLLAYAEMITMEDERAREAATELREKLLVHP